jgi:Polyketide cyclase / dehydrase and lipid transport
MIRPLVRLTIGAAVAAWLVDVWLAGRARSEGRTKPAPVDSLAVIEGPIDTVWAVVADIAGQPRWMTDMKAVQLDSPGPVGVGTRGVATIRMLGVAVRDPVVVTEFSPPTRFAVRHEGLFSGEGVIELEPGADGTTTIVRWSESIVPPVLPWLGTEALRPLFGAVFQADLGRLTDLVERGQAA